MEVAEVSGLIEVVVAVPELEKQVGEITGGGNYGRRTGRTRTS